MAEQQDITTAKGTYEGFLNLLKWGSVIAAVTTVLVVLIISN
ncbi:aa3-type cytochrome c oxidase subunit IV [Sphingorhabdus arenilitoris]|uniref:Aa3-type cytochrome c oxidase subunit IV n=1 Tax=Sphingorhabdus arenilitoris TaxID=1490041 RepID=A0ABV8RG86_9SPHN